MLVRLVLSTFALAKQNIPIQTAFNTRRSGRINDHDIGTSTTSQINQVEVKTRTIDQSRIKERHTLRISISRLPSAGFLHPL